MEIRYSKKEDATDMMTLEHLVWTKGTTPSTIHFDSPAEYLAKNPAGEKVVAVQDGVVVGILGYHSPTPLKSNQHVATLDIAVHPDYQKQGIAQELMTYLKEQAKNEGYTKLQLRVLSKNEKAIRFYQKNGFHEEGRLEKEFILDREPVDDIIMALFIED
ncbi:GNAT family N-acetyltransferase [Listeria fleischmannii]|uniref:GNAT family N-acetyltransferase n=2 Tax=Listeria fleischmannii TaxID=1069827 RepID=UPI000DFEFD81|nr:GNAT family N-acetyltransferase [Listeria fleischmannii]STY35671.1 N-acyltransferase YncA [Listeria fleischmannii subsp. coloradonensis]